MKEPNELSNLRKITQAIYEQRQQSFSRLVAEENSIRAKLIQLRDFSHQPPTLEPRIYQMRAIGADLLWQGWIGRSKTALNLRLARVLAAKEGHLNEVRHAYGKVTAIQEVYEDQTTAQRKDVSISTLEQAIDIYNIMRVKS